MTVLIIGLTAAAIAGGYHAVCWLRRRPKEDIGGRHVVITGGSEGIGLEVAKICVERGAVVTLMARSVEKLALAKKELLRLMPNAKVVVQSADVSDRAALAGALQLAETEQGMPPDICIAAAGSAIPKYFEDLTSDDFDRMLRVNYLGVVNFAKEVLPGMTSRDKGHFCAICSIAAAVPFIGYAAYAPAKAATRSFIDVLRNEFADTRIMFHIAFPPDTDTPGFAKENETKPYETAHVWPQCFNEVFAARKVAEDIVDDLLQGEYFIRSPDVFGNLIVSRAWGHYPRARPVLEAVIAPLFVFLQSGMVWLVDRGVRARAHHRAAL